ncbi:MAG: hypothetical protein M3P38_07925 [Chloroflexota bacterium]|nr:hypothetical protein [Chloroflexota bacterium]
MPLEPRSKAPTARSRPGPEAEPLSAGRTKQAAAASWPFFKPWMPHPMEKDEYQAWVAHLEAHPDEKANVIEAMERYDRSRR